jgi:hypothetical protein
MINATPMARPHSQRQHDPPLKAAPVANQIDRVEDKTYHRHQWRRGLDSDHQRHQRHGQERKAKAGGGLQQGGEKDDTE